MKRNLITFTIMILFCFVIQAAVDNRTRFGNNTEISPMAEIKYAHIGNDCKIMSFVSIGEKDVGHTDEIVIIGNDVVIEPQVVIAKGVRIGDHCRIRSGSIITGDIDDSTEVSVGVLMDESLITDAEQQYEYLNADQNKILLCNTDDKPHAELAKLKWESYYNH